MSPKRRTDSYPKVVARDAYDEATFDEMVKTSTALGECIESGKKLHPGFEALASDVFALLFKYTTLIEERPDLEMGRTALARRVVGWVRTTRDFERLRAETVLDEARATFGTSLVLKHVLRNLSKEEVFSPEELLEDFDIAAREEALEELLEQKSAAEALRDAREDASSALDAAIDSLGEEAEEAQRDLSSLVESQRERLDGLPLSMRIHLKQLAEELPERMAGSEEELSAFGRQMGAHSQGGMAAATKLELGEKLLTNEKLQRLAHLVGAFRQLSRSVRRARFERRPSEVHAVERGSDLARLLPAEVSQLRHPRLRRVFMRRFVEADLLQYAINANDKGARGPMVVCIDGSGSMAGDKELWAKAVCLTLMETARRQRRHFRAIVFSGGQRDLKTFDLLKMPARGRLEAPPIDVADLVDFADYFPRGGTDFQGPLDAALEVLEEKKLRRGDVVFITDGEAHVDPGWLAGFMSAKRRLEFKIYGVMVDMGKPSRTDVVARFADEITSVARLSAQSAGEIFLKL